MKVAISMFRLYFRRTIKDSFTIGYSILFPLIMIFLLGLLRKNSFSEEFSSYQYYTITMLPFCIFCEIITAAYLGQEEARMKVAERFLIAPITEKEILGTKLLAGVAALSVCHGGVLILAKLFWKINYGGKGFAIFLLMTAFTFVIFATGLLFGLGTKNFILIKNFMNIPIVLFAVLAGSFFPIGSFHPLVNGIFKLSPLTWINRSAFMIIYDKEAITLYLTLLCFVTAGLLMTLLATKKFRKEDFIHGDLFHYEK